MPAQIKIATRIPNRYRDAIGRVNTILVQAHKHATDESKSILRESIRASGAIATFDLYNSVRDRLRARSSRSAWYTREIYFARPADKYWKYADEGTRPHYAPIAPFIRWAAALGLPQFMAYVARAIVAEEGTEGAHFMRGARPQIKRRARTVMAQALRDIKKLFRGRE